MVNSSNPANDTETMACVMDSNTQCIIGICITSAGIVSNIAFIFVIFRVSSMRTVTNAYLVNLAISDLLHSITHSVIWNCMLIAGPSCFYLKGLNRCAFLLLSRVPQYVSMFTITILSVERYFALCKPILYRSGFIHDKRFVGGVIISTWTVSVMITMEGFVDCLYLVEARSVAGRIVYLLSVFVLLAITTVLYAIIVHRVKRSGHSVKKHERQIIRVCLATALVYFTCTMPPVLQAFVLVLYQFDLIVISPDLIHCLTNASTFLLEINSCVNPVIYNAMSSIYRRAFQTAFKCNSSKSGHSYQSINRNQSQPSTEMTEWKHTTQRSSRLTRI